MSKSQKVDYSIGNGNHLKKCIVIPEKYITQLNIDCFRPIARRQIHSLLERRKLTQKYSLYDREITKLIQYEKGVKY